MTLIALSIYILFLLFVFVASGFVIWHLLRYSLNKKQARLVVIIFVTLTIILVINSAYFFAQIPFDDLFTPSLPYETL